MACLVLDNAAVRGAVGVDGWAGLRRAVLGARSPQGGVEDKCRLPDLPLWAKLSSTSPVFRTASTRGAAVGPRGGEYRTPAVFAVGGGVGGWDQDSVVQDHERGK